MVMNFGRINMDPLLEKTISFVYICLFLYISTFLYKYTIFINRFMCDCFLLYTVYTYSVILVNAKW